VLVVDDQIPVVSKGREGAKWMCLLILSTLVFFVIFYYPSPVSVIMPCLFSSFLVVSEGREGAKWINHPMLSTSVFFLIFIIVSAVPVSFTGDRHHAMHPLELCRFLEFGLGVAITLRLHVQHFLLVACVTEWWVS
jgi:hypothetical protein